MAFDNTESSAVLKSKMIREFIRFDVGKFSTEDVIDNLFGVSSDHDTAEFFQVLNREIEDNSDKGFAGPLTLFLENFDTNEIKSKFYI